eukprot:TRINITY_DN6628_c0_g1_i1.p1 TRINITY_DN6628_c0_g1~~TRINITY_DN6628_c0_g1_i1.p1  ORF type:complete len:523 (+),score=144.20 TRINITY_DN6628_c0_g1_i1:29-1570(+)
MSAQDVSDILGGIRGPGAAGSQSPPPAAAGRARSTGGVQRSDTFQGTLGRLLNRKQSGGTGAASSPALDGEKEPKGALARELLALKQSARSFLSPSPAAAAAAATPELGGGDGRVEAAAEVYLPPTAFKPKRLDTLASLKEDDVEEVVRWVWAPFRNPARKDKVVFHHWVPSADVNKEYHFARFNKRIDMYTYTAEEYEQNLAHPNWTKAETDRLYELCRQFDLRWPVIIDRWFSDCECDQQQQQQPTSVPVVATAVASASVPPGVDASAPSPVPAGIPAKKRLEDLKERFYETQSKLVVLRASPGEDIDSHPVRRFLYYKELDVARREQEEKMWNRTAEQVAEEAALLELLRKLEKRSATKKLTPGSAPREKRRKSRLTEDDQIRPHKRRRTTGSSVAEPDVVQPTTAITAVRSDTPSAVVAPVAKKVVTAGVYLRSGLMNNNLVLGKEAAKKLSDMLRELSIPTRPPPMCTAAIAMEQLQLKQELVMLLELQKAISQREYETKQLEKRKAK